MEGASLLTGLLTAAWVCVALSAGLCGVHCLGEDVRGSGLGGADHVGVHAKSDRRVGMAQDGRDDCARDADSRQVVASNMSQVVQPCVWSLVPSGVARSLARYGLR